jgi:hypothetical protein
MTHLLIQTGWFGEPLTHTTCLQVPQDRFDWSLEGEKTMLVPHCKSLTYLKPVQLIKSIIADILLIQVYTDMKSETLQLLKQV